MNENAGFMVSTGNFTAVLEVFSMYGTGEVPYFAGWGTEVLTMNLKVSSNAETASATESPPQMPRTPHLTTKPNR